MTSATSPQAEVRRALARNIGLSAFVYGYPLIESWRTCAMQTAPHASGRAGASAGSDMRAPLNTLHHAPRPSTDEDRDVVTPANDLLYTVAWVDLSGGPMLLTVPSSARHPGRYFVLPLYDAYTENFENMGPRNCKPEGETVLLLGPDVDVPAALAGHRVVRCPTNLVWLIGRILAGDPSDWPAARALQAEIQLTPAPGTVPGGQPPTIAHWSGEPVDAIAAIESGQAAAQVAAHFFTNLCHALAETPGRVEDRGLLAWFAQAGIAPEPSFAWEALEPSVREGLIEGFSEGVNAVAAVGRGSRRPKPWAMTPATGRYGNEYLARARTAYLGLGALATSEAVYAAAHYDAAQEPLDGRRRYVMRFEAGELPPADAFWSVTLYDSDRFLYPNEIRRHAIGDRTPGLQWNADGSLEIEIGHARSADAANWLPAPAGRFYLILRMYYPRENLRSWHIPPLQAQPA